MATNQTNVPKKKENPTAFQCRCIAYVCSARNEIHLRLTLD